MGVNPDAAVVPSPQGGVRIHRDRRIDNGAAIMIDEIMREVGAPTGETDPDRRARTREHFALFVKLEQVAAEDVDQPAL